MLSVNRGVRSIVAALVAALCLQVGGCTSNEPRASAPPLPPGTQTPSPPDQEAPVPARPGITQRVVFGDPWSKDERRVHAVAESALKIIDETRRGETITLSMFNLTYPTAADTLIRARLRGVKVRVLVNSEGAGSSQVRKLKSALGGNPASGSWVVVRAPAIRMHSKFLLSSRSGGKANVVWVSSGNLTTANGRTQANEALVTTGDKRLYRFLGRQFALFRQGVTDPALLARTTTTDTAVVQTYPLPAGGPDHDPVLALLRDVRCTSGTERTTIRLAHLFLTVERRYLTGRLRELKAEGCDVRAVGHMKGWNREARKDLAAPGPGRIDLRSAQGTALHTKITTIEGWDAAGHPLKVAMVGTHNLTGRALSTTPDGVNDEVSLIIRDARTVHSYSAWVDRVISRHSRPDTPRG